VLDDDDRLRPGEKYYKWEMFGVPVRVEVGPREVDARAVTLVRRDTKERSKAGFTDLEEAVRGLFADIFETLKARSKKRLDSELADAVDLDELKALMDERKIVRANWCGDPHCAFQLKDEVAGEVRGTLWDEHEEPDGCCIVCGDQGKQVAYVSRTY
jgi:prolyl-tRNA synthetase